MSAQLSDTRVFELVSGLWKSERQPLMRAKVLRATNFRGDGMIDFENVVTLDVEERYAGTRRLQSGDIIIERSGGGANQPVGRAALFVAPDDAPYFTSNFTTAIRIKDRVRYEPRFVAHFLNALYLSGATEPLQRKPTGIRNLDWQEFLRFEVPFHDLCKQKTIADILDAVRAATRIEARQGDLAQSLRSAAMRELFARGLRGEPQKETEIGPIPTSWDVVAFADVREWLQYGTSTRCIVEPAGHPVLRIPNVQSGRVSTDGLKYCKMPDDEAAKYLLEAGDLLFIRTNGVLERLGSCAVFRGEPAGALFASYLIRARPKSNVEPRFAAYFYGSERGTSVVAGSATPAADGKYNLNTGTIDSLPLPLPKTREEQQEIVSILDAIDQKINLHRRKQAVLEALFKSLLHKLMTGEVRVADLDLSALPEAEEAPS
jgi:type I restriction enzyme S subunit